jgi:MFS family permease
MYFYYNGHLQCHNDMVEDIVKPRGIISYQAGLIGGILVVAGLAGAIILPALSDKMRRRCPFLFWPIILSIPGFAGLAFFSDYKLLLLSAALMGFFIMGMGPVAFQYGAETAYPVAEGTSYGMLMLAGQVAGILFIYVMDLFRDKDTGDMTASLAVFILLMAISFILASRLKESSLITGSDGKSDFSA